MGASHMTMLQLRGPIGSCVLPWWLFIAGDTLCQHPMGMGHMTVLPVMWAYGIPCPAMMSPNAGQHKEDKLLYPDHYLVWYAEVDSGPHTWPAAPDVIWHIYSHLYCSSRVGGRDLLSSGEAAPTMRQVSCEFWADRPTFIFQLVAPDMIWHIYSHLYCSSEDGGRDLLSSEGQPIPWGWSPVSFRQISLGAVFQGKSWNKGPSSLTLPIIVHHLWPVAPDVIWHIYLHLYCSSRDGGRDLPSSGEAAPTMGQVPCEFWADWPNFIFQPVAPDVIWHIYSGQRCFKGF